MMGKGVFPAAVRRVPVRASMSYSSRKSSVLWEQAILGARLLMLNSALRAGALFMSFYEGGRQEPDGGREAALQRAFLAGGLPFSLKGYAYLKRAAEMAASGESLSMAEIYRRIGKACGGTAASVERAIRYAVKRCQGQLFPEGARKLTPGQFILWLAEAGGAAGAPEGEDGRPSVEIFDR